MDKTKRRKPKKRNLMIAAQNNDITTNYTKETIDNSQNNSSCWLWSNRDKTARQIINES